MFISLLNPDWRYSIIEDISSAVPEENYCILNEIWLKYGQMDDRTAKVQVMAWCWKGDKKLSESAVIQFTYTYLCHLWLLLLTWINFNPSMDK